MAEESKAEENPSYEQCYLDVAVQILYNTIPFRSSLPPSKQLSNAVSQELHQIFSKMRKGNRDFFDSSSLKKALINKYGKLFDNKKGYEPVSTITYILRSIYKDQKVENKKYQEIAHLKFGNWPKGLSINESLIKVWGFEYFLHYDAEPGLFSIKIMPNTVTWISHENKFSVKIDNFPEVVMIEGKMNANEDMWESFLNSEKEWYSKDHKGFYKLTGVIFYSKKHFIAVYYSNDRKKWTKIDNQDLEETDDFFDFLKDNSLKPIFLIFTWTEKASELDETPQKENPEDLPKQDSFHTIDWEQTRKEQPSIEEQNIEQLSIEQSTTEQPSIEKQNTEVPHIKPPIIDILPIDQSSIQQFADWSIIEEASIEKPVIDQPSIGQSPLIEEPSNDQPAIKQPSIEQSPLTEEPSNEQPVIEQPSIVQPPLIEEPSNEQSIIEQLSIEESPLIEEPSSEHPAIKQPSIEQPPLIEEPSIEQPIIEQSPLIEEPSSEQPSIEQPSIDQPPLIEEPSIKQPIIEQPSIEQSPIEDPSNKQLAIKQPSIDKPNIEEPVIEQSNTEELPIEQPGIKQPEIENFYEEELLIEQPHKEEPYIEEPNVEQPYIELPDIEPPCNEPPYSENQHIEEVEPYQYDEQSYFFLIENLKETNTLGQEIRSGDLRRRINRINVAECQRCGAFYPTYIGKCIKKNCK